MSKVQNNAILLIHCPDQKGIVAAITDFLHSNSGNVVSLEQHVDPSLGHFFMRVAWELDGFSIPKNKIDDYFNTLVASKFSMSWQLKFSEPKQRMAIFVSKASHCFYDILQRHYSGEWHVDIPVIISNHDKLQPVAERFGIDFQVFSITKETKAAQEAAEKALLQELNVDFIVLARYMQILSDDFCGSFPNQIINIHHSFLPAFKGARPYHSAYARGVKVIGATSHYVTSDLDEGPIIAQDVVSVSHRDDPQALVRKGKDVEKRVLSNAIRAQLEHKVLPFGNKTIVFE